MCIRDRICTYLGQKLGAATVSSFSDGEIRVKVDENVRGADIFVVQSTCQPVNDSLLELLIIIDALKRSSANRITAVIPYFGYGRQDRKDQPRVPISAKLVADLISTAGADRVLTMDLHAGQIQGLSLIHISSTAIWDLCFWEWSWIGVVALRLRNSFVTGSLLWQGHRSWDLCRQNGQMTFFNAPVDVGVRLRPLNTISGGGDYYAAKFTMKMRRLLAVWPGMRVSSERRRRCWPWQGPGCRPIIDGRPF